MRMTTNGRLVGVTLVVLGIASGALGAVVFAHLARSPKTAPPPIAAERESQAIVPPGWDLAMASRLAQVERKVDDLQLPPRLRPPARKRQRIRPLRWTKKRATLEEREKERAAHYQKELDYREKALADHASETSDGAWAGPQAASMAASQRGSRGYWKDEAGRLPEQDLHGDFLVPHTRRCADGVAAKGREVGCPGLQGLRRGSHPRRRAQGPTT